MYTHLQTGDAHATVFLDVFVSIYWKNVQQRSAGQKEKVSICGYPVLAGHWYSGQATKRASADFLYIMNETCKELEWKGIRHIGLIYLFNSTIELKWHLGLKYCWVVVQENDPRLVPTHRNIVFILIQAVFKPTVQKTQFHNSPTNK